MPQQKFQAADSGIRSHNITLRMSVKLGVCFFHPDSADSDSAGFRGKHSENK